MNALAARNLSGHNLQSPVTVLVLDDDAFDRKRVRRWIERNTSFDVSLTEAVDLSGFQDCLARGSFDLVLLDYALEDGTGLDAVKLLRDHPNQRRSYAVIISGRDDDSLRGLCLREGCDQFMSKSALDASRIAGLIETVTSRNMPATTSRCENAQTAIGYWRSQAERRARLQPPVEQASNLEILRERLGIELEALGENARNVSKLATAGSDVVFDEAMSAALRLFIADFLSADEFEFIPEKVAEASECPHR